MHLDMANTNTGSDVVAVTQRASYLAYYCTVAVEEL